MVMMKEDCITSEEGIGPIECACIAWKKAAIKFDASAAAPCITYVTKSPTGSQADGHIRSIGY